MSYQPLTNLNKSTHNNHATFLDFAILNVVSLSYKPTPKAMTPTEKINAYNERVKQLFEKRFTQSDWNNKVKGTKSYLAQCQKQAESEIFNK